MNSEKHRLVEDRYTSREDEQDRTYKSEELRMKLRVRINHATWIQTWRDSKSNDTTNENERRKRYIFRVT